MSGVLVHTAVCKIKNYHLAATLSTSLFFRLTQIFCGRYLMNLFNFFINTVYIEVWNAIILLHSLILRFMWSTWLRLRSVAPWTSLSPVESLLPDIKKLTPWELAKDEYMHSPIY